MGQKTEVIKEKRAKHLPKVRETFKFPEIGEPFLWPFLLFLGYEEEGLEILRDDLKYLKEVEKTQIEKPKPAWATKNKVRLDLNTLKLRDFSQDASDISGIYTLIVALYAGHRSYFSNSRLS